MPKGECAILGSAEVRNFPSEEKSTWERISMGVWVNQISSTRDSVKGLVYGQRTTKKKQSWHLEAISSDRHLLQLFKLHHFKLERFKSI